MSRLAPMTATTPCSRCGKRVPTAEAVAKRVTFTTIPKPIKVVRSRTLEWLCRPCAEGDPVWSMPPYSSPGDTGADQATT